MQWLLNFASVVLAIVVIVDRLRWSDQYKAAHENIVRSKSAEIARLEQEVKFSQTSAQERLKSKDDYIDLLKLQRAPDTLSVLKANEELRERVITTLQTQLADLQESHARSEEESEQEIDNLRDQLYLA